MQWELAHRRRDAAEATYVTVEMSSSREAIAAVKSEIPEDEVILYIKRLD
jgi:hypothetical protein